MKLTKEQITEKREEPRWDVTAKEKLANSPGSVPFSV